MRSARARMRCRGRAMAEQGGGHTKRGVPPDYAGDDPYLCNARTKSGRPCRALKLAGGRCKWHGGLSTGPTTPEGKAQVARNLVKARRALARLRASTHQWAAERNCDSSTRGHE